MTDKPIDFVNMNPITKCAMYLRAEANANRNAGGSKEMRDISYAADTELSALIARVAQLERLLMNARPFLVHSGQKLLVEHLDAALESIPAVKGNYE